MKIEHSEKCLNARARERANLAAYESKWPNFCRECGATGESAWIKNQAPIGEGHWGMMMSEPCENCVGQGRCPQCGSEHNNFQLVFDAGDADVALRCFDCDYNSETTTGAPEVLNPYECGCFEDALEIAQ